MKYLKDKDTFYYFPPWRKQFIFSKNLLNTKKTISIYRPYKLLSSFFWICWTKSSFFRSFFKLPNRELPTLFIKICQYINLDEYLLEINNGTNGPEQKMTILANKNNFRLFIKAGNSSISRNLIANEAKQLSFLNGTINTPKLINFINNKEIAILVTEQLSAEKISFQYINIALYNIIVKINSVSNIYSSENILYCFAHGDFCPWNILQNSDGEYILVDWELAKILPLGYDLFTFIFQSSFLLIYNRSEKEIFNSNYNWIIKYFNHYNITNFYPYLLIFIKLKITEFSNKENYKLVKKWESLENYVNKLQ